MCAIEDEVKALIADTKNGKLDWEIGTDSGGYWLCNCEGV